MSRAAPIEDRFFAKVAAGEGGCWIWTGALDKAGYAHFRADTQRTALGHRWAYLHFVGPIPDGLDLDHLCRVTRCVNPEHLEPVTRKENVRRGANVALKTHCAQGHAWVAPNIYTAPNGERQCWICRRERDSAKRVAA